MARFCNKCGSPVSEKASFCNACGKPLAPRNRNKNEFADNPANSSVKETIPVWSGWEAAAPVAAPAPTAPVNATPLLPTPSAVPVAPAQDLASAGQANSIPSAAPIGPPQSWESYDYVPTDSATGSSMGSRSEDRPRDSSRPLPPLSDFFAQEDQDEMQERAKDTIMNFSLWAAGIVLFPIPFSDIVLLMPIQSAMVMAVARIYGVKDTPERILAIIAGACGASVFGQITTLLLANCIPFIGKFISAPFVFGWTYGLGEVAIRYFETNGKASSDELKQIYKKASKDASGSYDSSSTKVPPKDALNNIRDYISEEEYQKIRERFGPESK